MAPSPDGAVAGPRAPSAQKPFDHEWSQLGDCLQGINEWFSDDVVLTLTPSVDITAGEVLLALAMSDANGDAELFRGPILT